MNLNKDTPVALYIKPDASSALLILELFLKGIPQVILNTKLSDDEIKNQVVKSKARFFVSNVGKELLDIESYNAIDFYKEFLSLDIKNSENLEDESFVLFTSGSTKEPKGVVLTRANIISNVIAYKDRFEFNSNDCWLLSLPIYHVGGLMILMRSLFLGINIYIPKDISLKRIVDLSTKNFITQLSLVPSVLTEIFKSEEVSKLVSKKLILIGGAKVSNKLVDKCQRLNLPIAITYGMTELSSSLSISNIKDFQYKSGYVGEILKGFECRIINDELEVRGHGVFKNYIDSKNCNTWFKTGDLARIDNEKLYIVGRKDRMIISGGENIYPEEIERECCNINGIKECVVISKTDDKWGQRPILFFTGDDLPKNIFTEYLSHKLPKYKIPDYFMYLESIPLLSNGKTDYINLSDLAKSVPKTV